VAAIDDAQIRRLALGCFLPGFVGQTPPRWLIDGLADGLGGVILFGSNLGDGDAVATLTGSLRAAAGRPVVVGLDEEGGDVTRLDAVRGSSVPGAAALGWLDDVAATEAVYGHVGARLAAAGVTLDLAPVADVNSDSGNPVIGVRSFSDSAAVAARHVAAAVRGLQRAGTAACAKHFPGHGATSADSHHEVATVDRSLPQLAEVELAPFRSAIAAGTRAVMTGHLLVPALDRQLATVSHPITTGLLRNSLGFDGTIVTDALEMKAVSDTIGMVEGFVRALIAGADAIETGALEYPELLTAIPQAVLAAVHSGRLPIERLADAARRTASLAGQPQADVIDPAVDGQARGALTAEPAHSCPGLSPAELAVIAARCVEVQGNLPALIRPLVIECRSANGMATGALPWSFANAVSARFAGTDVVTVDGYTAELPLIHAERSLICVIRDPGRNPWQHWVIDLALGHHSAAGAAVLVDVGWPAELPSEVLAMPQVRTRGIAPGQLLAAASVLAAANGAAVSQHP
jgi:beta-N-acetylhexosaminidase